MGRKDETWKGVGGEMIVKLFVCFLHRQWKMYGNTCFNTCSLFLSPCCNAAFPPHTIQNIHCTKNSLKHLLSLSNS